MRSPRLALWFSVRSIVVCACTRHMCAHTHCGYRGYTTRLKKTVSVPLPPSVAMTPSALVCVRMFYALLFYFFSSRVRICVCGSKLCLKEEMRVSWQEVLLLGREKIKPNKKKKIKSTCRNFQILGQKYCKQDFCCPSDECKSCGKSLPLSYVGTSK